MILLSILTPAVPKRLEQLGKLCVEIEGQINGDAVEHLVLMDNKKRTVGEKRDALLRAARGQYVAFVDDDDWIVPDYVREILKATESGPDVVTFKQVATVNKAICAIEFRLGNPNEEFISDPDENKIYPPTIKRNAWHVCAWKRSLAMLSNFPASNYGEDWAFSAPLCKLAKTEVHIPKVLHFYRHSSETTEAPPP